MRNIQKAIEQYQQIATGKTGEFYTSDVYQIYEKGRDAWDWITDALMVGYAIGYRQCKQQMKKAPAARQR